LSANAIQNSRNDDVETALKEERARIEQERELRQEARILNFEDELEQQTHLYRNVILFKMGIQTAFTKCSTIHGVFTQADLKTDRYVFAETFGTRPTEHHTCIQLLSKRLGRLLQYFCEHKLVVVLKGSMCENHGKVTFYVNSIHNTGIPQNGETPSYVDDMILQGIAARLAAEEDPMCLNEETYRQHMLPAKKEELLLLYHLLKDELPAEHRSWVEYSLRQAESNELSRDEKKHTLRAVSYLLNVEWRPRQIRLPPVREIRELLDRAIFGMEPVKKCILEIAAQIRRSGEIPKWGVLLEGPPGVGKTTIAKAVAGVLGLPLVSVDLSTIRDPESLSGSSRRYINARPGMILEKIFENRSGSGVLVLNELDKAFAEGHRGSCEDALLSLVDRQGFQDDFMETSVYPQFFCLATCNDAQAISKPLLDRFIPVRIDRYTEKEKRSIFQNYVMPKTLEAAGVSNSELTVSPEFVEQLCRDYAAGAGGRDLEKAAQRIVGDYLLRCEQEDRTGRRYTQWDLEELFGKKPAVLERTVRAMPGQVMTMFCNEEMAQPVLVQATKRNGSGRFELIGVPTEFYRDCCRAAYECVKNMCANVDFSCLDVTVYLSEQLPSGSKNNLGCAVFMAIMSALTGKVVPETSVFLGGCDLMGNVFFDETTIDPVLECMDQIHAASLYGAANLAQLAERTGHIKVVGAFSASVLWEVAV